MYDTQNQRVVTHTVSQKYMHLELCLDDVISIHTHAHTHTYTQAHTHTHTHTHTHIHTYIHFVYASVLLVSVSCDNRLLVTWWSRDKPRVVPHQFVHHRHEFSTACPHAVGAPSHAPSPRPVLVLQQTGGSGGGEGGRGGGAILRRNAPVVAT